MYKPHIQVISPTRVNVNCVQCKTPYTIPVTTAQLEAWHGGMLIQYACNHLSIADRELLISGMCDPCFTKLFAE